MARLGIATIFVLTILSRAYACDPNEECNRCLASAFGHCITHGNDPICETRKGVCQQCANIKGAATGLSLGCVSCVMVSTPANPTCIAICGGAANAEAVAAAGNCD
jgi:hypothetical protein